MHHYGNLAQNNHLTCYCHSTLILNSGFIIILFMFTEFHAKDLSERNSLYVNLNKFYQTDSGPGLLPLSFLLVDKDTGGIKQSKPSKLSRQAWRSQRVRPAPAQQSREDSQDRRHPFALYGSGEKDADTAGRKTHNVCPAASTHEVTSVWPSTDLHTTLVRGTDCYVSFPVRSMSLLYVLRPGGRWSVRSRPRGVSAVEPSQPMWTKPERWSNQNLTPGSQSTCAASLCALDRTHKHHIRV